MDRVFSELWLASRFLAAGVVNTAVGLSVILALDLGLHVPSAIANGLGYAVGICVAWVMHRSFVFRAEDTGWSVKLRYVTAVATAFLLNQIMLAGTERFAGHAPTARALAQSFGVVTYTLVQFILLRTWVFRARRRSADAG